MDKTLVLTCTNRPNSYTAKVAAIYQDILHQMGVETAELSLEELPNNIAFSELYGQRTFEFTQLIASKISAYRRFIFVVPEYNGGFPGILKLFIDAIHPREWLNKKVCLVGVSSGRAGNLRGMEHLTGVLCYLKMHVYHNRLPISQIDKIMNSSGQFIQEEQQQVCEAQVRGFLDF